MKYMLLIYSDPSVYDDISEEEQSKEMGEYFAFTTALVESGKFIAGDPLQGIDTATTVTVRDGATLTTDGPFAETKEVLGGYYLLDADDLDEAVSWAAQIPGARLGKIEVRPLVEMPPMG